VTDEQVKAALAALADGTANADETATSTATDHCESGPGDYRATIRRAVEAQDDLEAAASFVESVGVRELERAVERAEREVSGLAAEGRDALAAFRAFRAAADSDRTRGPFDP
jgi:hypothetical protein